MKLNLYTIHDIKSGIFNAPIAFVNEDTMVRSFTREFQKPGSVIHDFPADYRVYLVGTWDDANGIIIPRSHPQMVREMKSIVGSKKDEV